MGGGKDSHCGMSLKVISFNGAIVRASSEEEQEQEPEQSGAAQEAWMVHTHARRDHPIKISAMSVQGEY